MTNDARQNCPDLASLEAFAAKGDDAQSEIADHLVGCSACRATVDEITANRDLFDELVRRFSSEQARPDSRRGRRGDDDLTLGGYDILGEVERGGQGVVYRARHRATNRIVALKVLLAGTFATSAQRRRFEREIELVAALSHPNIVTVYDSGVTENGCPYLSMQFVEGVKLDEWLAQQTRGTTAGDGHALERRLQLFAKICDGVNEAHQHGVIHRDLKPANVIVDEDNEPHILDFGIARPVLDFQSATAVTDEGAFLGTLAYASPEQVRRNPALIDTRSDVYSLGVILYEILTGEVPFDTSGDLTHLLHAITSERPDPPSARRRVSHRAGRSFRDELDWIVLKTLTKEKDRRYQTAAELRDDVLRFLRGEPVEARRDSRAYLARKMLARHRVSASIAALFLIVLVASTIALFVLYRAARDEAEKVKQINIFLEDTLGSVEPAQAGGAVTVGELLDEGARWIDIALSDQPEIAAAIETIIGNSYRNLGDLHEAERHLQSALRRRLALFGPDHVEVAHSLSVLALLRRDEGRLDEAENLLRESLEVRRDRLGSGSMDVAFTLANLALVLRDRGAYDEAQSLLEESLAIRKRHRGEVHSDVAMCLFTLASVAELKGEHGRALELHREALQMRRKVLHRRHPDLARSLSEVGRVLLETGEPAAAGEVLRECLQLRIDALGRRHAQSIDTRAQLGRALIDANQLEEAERILLEGTERGADGSPTARPADASVIEQLIALYEKRGDLAKAESWRKLLSASSGG